jgi:hypothetical protein
LQELLGMLERLVRVVGQKSLVEVFYRRERWSIPEQHVEELEPVHVPPKHHEADGERRGEHQSDRSPQHVQKIAATRTAKGDSPVLWP